ncbi:ASF1 anti-silencing function 1, variant 2 [Perkinsus olseni]|uniref:ASF1 anti-silencing function 1, variant 2 n=1 Tax=Perkinsus olseni TaxID=32597 RepID=A0A7J6PH30_PEROL|nr:ASF1 anti-silencing function 1, variant 2 [Perkinsus olseni]
MSIVSVTEVSLVGDNPCKASDKLSFEIQFEALKELKEDLEWAMVYVADANDSSKDQELDTVELGPVEVATMKFTFEAPAPDLTKVAKEDVLDVTGLFISASYQTREFCRIGFYLKHEYDNEEMNNEPPEEIDFTRLLRKVDVENPRITKYVINWDEENEELQQPYLPDASAETGDDGVAAGEGIAFDTAVPLDKDAEVEVTDDEDEPDSGDVECSEPDEAPVENLEQPKTSQEGESQDMEVVAKRPRLDSGVV